MSTRIMKLKIRDGVCWVLNYLRAQGSTKTNHINSSHTLLQLPHQIIIISGKYNS